MSCRADYKVVLPKTLCLVKYITGLCFPKQFVLSSRLQGCTSQSIFSCKAEYKVVLSKAFFCKATWKRTNNGDEKTILQFALQEKVFWRLCRRKSFSLGIELESIGIQFALNWNSIRMDFNWKSIGIPLESNWTWIQVGFIRDSIQIQFGFNYDSKGIPLEFDLDSIYCFFALIVLFFECLYFRMFSCWYVVISIRFMSICFFYMCLFPHVFMFSVIC